jgi:starvation-inducible DNA-binding protein
MHKVKSALPEDARRVTGQALQDSLIDLIDLSLTGKQAHWNLTGRYFRPIHLQLDEVVSLARRHADIMAERAVAIGVNPDGRVRTVSEITKVHQMDAGYQQDDKVVATITNILGEMVQRFRERVDATAVPDPVTQDLLLTVTQDLEKQHWMFEVQQR